MGTKPSPPPYEATAYPVAPAPRPRLKTFFSLRTLLGAILTTTLVLLYLTLQPPPRFRQEPIFSYQASLRHLRSFEGNVKACKALYHMPDTPKPQSRKENPRWNKKRGQQMRTVLRNMTLFDGEKVLPKPMDITFDKGLIIDVSETPESWDEGTNLFGRFVTPGLVDMHSHHALESWPAVGHNDGNEMHPDTGPVTPMVRIIDSMTARDAAIRIIMSGGVTSSLVIPGSANIMGGEGVPVKNVEMSGPNGEYVVEEMLLEHGVPEEDRRRYIKMACGENPSRVYGHTRMGNAWILRHQLERARALLERQDRYCAGLEDVLSAREEDKVRFVLREGSLPSELELDSSVGLLRGRVLMQNHCYEPRDFETMLRVSREFGFRVRAFHHATEAWQVPEMLKEYGQNVTVAIFAEFSLYKMEAYYPSLTAGYRLNYYGVPVAYKSDHVNKDTNAKYLMTQAAIGHNWFLPTEKALQAVTSVPAKALDLDFRIGYARKGYDADIVLWDAHPLSAVANPLQVYVDGVPQLAPEKVRESMGSAFTENEAAPPPREPAMRVQIKKEARDEFCTGARERKNIVVTGLSKAVLKRYPELQAGIKAAGEEKLTLVVNDGEVACLGGQASCNMAAANVSSKKDATTLNMKDGYLVPGFVALTAGLGLVEISMEPMAADGFPVVPHRLDPKNWADDIPYAKYGVHLEGKAFGLARIGGITRAISAPGAPEGGGGFIGGVSVGIYTDERKTVLDGGIFKGEVALHLSLGDNAKKSEQSVGNAVKKLRKALNEGKDDAILGGGLPILVEADNKYDIQHLVLLKKDFPHINLIIQGGAEAPYVAKEIAQANISMILTNNRGAPDTFWVKDAVVGPPLTRSIASHLREAGVRFGIGFISFANSQIQDLPLEAAWAGRYAGMELDEALGLVSTEVEDILGLDASGDMVLWEGSPLEFGGTVALALGKRDGKLEVVSCWPGQEENV